MLKEVLIYGYISAYSATEFFKAIAEAGKEILIRICSEGGEPEYMWGMMDRATKTENAIIQVDGKAHSALAFGLCYAPNAQALDVANFVLHRAAYPEWFEASDTLFTESHKTVLANVNAKLEKGFRAKVDVAKFEEMKGMTVKELFSMDGRKEVVLTAKEAKAIGLINKIIPLTPKLKAEIESNVAIAANHNGPVKIAASEPENKNTMLTLEELKAKHPDIYAQVIALGRTEGITAGVNQERSRVRAWGKFVKVDAVAVQKGIDDGAEMTMEVVADFTAKSFAVKTVGEAAAGAAAAVTTAPAAAPVIGATQETAEQIAKKKELTDFAMRTGKLTGVKAEKLEASANGAVASVMTAVK